MLLALALVQVLSASSDPVLAGALFCLGEQPLPETYVRQAPGRDFWRLLGPESVIVSKVGATCIVTRAPVGAAEPAFGAWIATRRDFKLDKDRIDGVRIREYVKDSDSGRLHVRLVEPATLEYPAFSPPTGVTVWTEVAPK